MVDYDQEPRDHSPSTSVGPMVPTKFAMDRMNARDQRSKQEKLKKQKQKDAVDHYKEYSSSFADWTFDKLEKEVELSDPATKNIIIKRNIYRNYLNDIGPQSPGNALPAQRQLKPESYQKVSERFSEAKRQYDEYQESTIKPFEKETKKIKAKIEAVASLEKAHSKVVGKWTFQELADEVEKSNPATKAIIEKRAVYMDYLKKIDTPQVELDAFNNKTEEVKKAVAVEKAKPGKISSFVSGLMSRSKSEVKGGTASPPAGQGQGAAKGKNSGRGSF